MTPPLPPYEMSDLGQAVKRKAPAVSRNREAIEAVLGDWLSEAGTLLEIGAGTGEHALAFSTAFPSWQWLPTDPDPSALASIAAWGEDGPANLHAPRQLDAASDDWPIEAADAILSINMVHIAPWQAAEGLVRGAGRLLSAGGKLILYGPWLRDGVETAPSNLAFDESLKSRNPLWGLRRVEDFASLAQSVGLKLIDEREMPSNNRMLLFRMA